MRDVVEGMESQWSMLRSFHRVGNTIAIHAAPKFDRAKVEQARRDRVWVRRMGHRYAQDNGIEARRRPFEDASYNENTPINREIRDALLAGDAEGARTIARDHLATLRSRKAIETAMASIQGSIRAFRPALVMEAPNAYEAQRFRDWAEKNLTAEGWERLKRSDDSYLEAAKKSGLWNYEDKNEDGLPDTGDEPTKKGEGLESERRKRLKRDEVRGIVDEKLPSAHQPVTQAGPNIGPSTEDDEAIHGTVKGAMVEAPRRCSAHLRQRARRALARSALRVPGAGPDAPPRLRAAFIGNCP